MIIQSKLCYPVNIVLLDHMCQHMCDAEYVIRLDDYNNFDINIFSHNLFVLAGTKKNSSFIVKRKH